MKNKINSFIITSLLFCIVLFLTCFGGGICTKAFALFSPEFEEKEIWDGIIEEEFSDSSVMVVVDKYHSGINKVHEEDFFGTFDKVYITDLTLLSGNIDNLNYVNKTEFRQIFQIGLPKNDKAQVVHAIEELEQIPGIKYAGPNYRYQVQEKEQIVQTRTATTSDDYLNQWGLNKIEANKAYNLLSTNNLAEVKVGIIDTGITIHDSLNVLSGRYFYRNPNNSDEVLWNDNTQDLSSSGHGTAVAGLVAAILPDVQLVPLKTDFWGNEVAAAVTYAFQNNIDILNFSGGYRARSSNFKKCSQ